MGTNSGELREILIEAITAVRKGDLDHDDAKAIALLASQVNASLQVEVDVRREEKLLGHQGAVALIGDLNLGTDKGDKT